jgi:hypothetical protein
MPTGAPVRKLSKSKFSMYLRTQCDRELYLSLFSNDPPSLQAAGIPIPLKSRPGVQLITNSGKDFEFEQYDQLIVALPNNVIHAANGRTKIAPSVAFAKATASSFILQPNIEPQQFRSVALGNLGLSQSDQNLVPELAGLIPDVVYVHEAVEGEHEVLPDGSRRRIEDGELRLGISVIDLKNVTEANASYSAEVCLYAFFLSNWLASQGNAFKDKFFVSDRVYLWRHVEMPRFKHILGTAAGGDHNSRIKALVEDLEVGLVNYLIYMPSVRKFFQEDVPRVVQKGDTEGWQAVTYHVNPRCSSCDWLGNPNWLIGDNLQFYKAHPEHYCSHSAEATDHLSKMANLSKGASLILKSSGHSTVKHLVGIPPTADVLKKHALLKKERLQIGDRANALSTGKVTIDKVGRIGGLARFLNAEYDIVVNFDAGSGFLTGIAVRGMLYAPYQANFSLEPDGKPKTFVVLGEQAFVVPKDNMAAEWSALQSFIEQLGGWIEQAEATFKSKGWGSIKTQICFWEERQYEELCNAFGRHLLSILNLSQRHRRALAWIFPSERLMEKDDQICPGLIFVRDIVDSALRLPVRFSNTLLSTVRHYQHPKMSPRSVDRYYEEPLSNAIPRERIFEIWKSPTGTVKSYGKTISIQEAIQKYGDVLNAHTWALSSISRQLRIDLRDVIQGRAPALSLSIPQGIAGVAYDSKLWGQWAKVSAATTETEDRLALIARAESLEASYKAVILTQMVSDLGGHLYEFAVSEESTEAKIEEGDSYCAVGVVSWPGFTLQTGNSLGLDLLITEDEAKMRVPVHKVIAATVVGFDRANKRAKVRFRARGSFVEPIFDALMDHGLIPIGKEPIYLLPGLSPDDSEATIDILREIGTPACAIVAKESLLAMGKTAAKALPKGTDPDTPIARVLWQAGDLAKAKVRTDAAANAIKAFAKTANPLTLNDSQQRAVKACALYQLAVIWGPPGTGKTDTLVALLHAMVREPGNKKKILIAGPNYRTVEELSARLLRNLTNDTNGSADVFWVYSRTREPKEMPDIPAHLNALSFSLEDGSPEVATLIASMGDANRTTIISTTSHTVTKVTDAVSSVSGYIQPIYDVVVLDESSQIDVTLALRPLTALAPHGQIIVAGDHLQMPPIQSLDPPEDAEYMVGSIQTYLLERFKVQKQELLINYRSNQDLVDYAKTLGYPSKLKAFNGMKQLRPLKKIDSVISAMPVELPKSSGYQELLQPERRVTALIHEDVVSSQANEFEAKLVAGLAYCIRHAMAQEPDLGTGGTFTPFTDESLFKEGLGIVTPHKAQKALVIQELRTLFPKADPQHVFEAVDTVERFQGGERQTIIVSFGIGDIDVIEGEEEFLLQMERTNVAVSRAKSKCIILMPKSLAYHLPTDQKAAETAMAIKSYIEEFCVHRTKVTIDDGTAQRAGEVRWH